MFFSDGSRAELVSAARPKKAAPGRPAKRPVGARRILPSSRTGPNPLGENQSLSSPPLEPRGLLLSVMRQKVGKERSQGDCHPLAIPRCYPNLAETTLAKRPVGALRCLQEEGEGAAGHANRACGQKSGSASLASHTPSGPDPLGENITLSSPPLEPRGLLLSVMRQKVGKERSQEGCAPLANPRRNGPNLAETTLAKRPVGALRCPQE